MTREQIYGLLPHRYEFMLLDGALVVDAENGRMVAFADLREDAWWARGHIPDRPMLPGVLMIEMGAHAASYYYRAVLGHPGFLAFAGLEVCKFRGTVEPPCRLHLLGTAVDVRPRRSVCVFQGLVGDRMAFEGKITGIPIE